MSHGVRLIKPHVHTFLSLANLRVTGLENTRDKYTEYTKEREQYYITNVYSL